jgi:hypothetical protein
MLEIYRLDQGGQRRGGSMTLDRDVFTGILVGFALISAISSEIIFYTYDSRGRLVKVERSGSVNNNVSAEYKYDKGDNRANVNVVSPN